MIIELTDKGLVVDFIHVNINMFNLQSVNAIDIKSLNVYTLDLNKNNLLISDFTVSYTTKEE